jgi:hypothetical protein
MLKQIKEWWNQPPARDRILAAMSAEWQYGLNVARTSNTRGSFYVHVLPLERDRIVESKWEVGPPDPRLGGHRRRLYRLRQRQ